MITLSRAQLCMLRSVRTKGWPVELLRQLELRVGAAEGEWQALHDAGLVAVERNTHFVMTPAGRRQYKTQSQGKYF